MSRPPPHLLLPALLVVLAAAAFLASGALRPFAAGGDPGEQITVERTELDGNGMALLVRAGGSEPVEIAQVQVDGAYWTFTLEPPGPLPGLGSAWLRLPYPWVHGEVHHVVMLSPDGAAFEHTVDAVPAVPERHDPLALLAVGLLVGMAPLALGMLFRPRPGTPAPAAYQFGLALVMGLLVFLLARTVTTAVALAGEAAPGLQTATLIWPVGALTALGLLAFGRRRHRVPEPRVAAGLRVALHHLGAGLAIGAAFAAGHAGLGSFLVLGFTLCGVLAGMELGARLAVDGRLRPGTLAATAGLAGLPAIVGIGLGGLAAPPHWAALGLAVGAGILVHAIVAAALLALRRARTAGGTWLTGPTVAGVALGMALTYGTAAFLAVV
jgi:zinc transporter ZupT